MDKQIDARGMNCPLPVIHTKKALEGIDEGKVTTIVDNEVAKENVAKLAKSLTLEVDIKESQGHYYIDIFKGQQTIGEITTFVTEDDNPKKDLVILITTEVFGEGEEELGKILMKGYIYALTEVRPYPKSIIFLNNGVKLTVEGSPVIEHLIALEANGVEILACGTCLDYYKLKNKLLVGSISNMYTIAEKLNNSKNTIKL
ncbi:sulfurtransferase-like selenium metabolism protein YedF [Alkaliphilus serpentinus]|uniref:Sulfurtransferase-like selenium metabolism protein YedF n=1 Tax=Alkaliphilus serpentinus TaxID=1482731 RepID=A0A833HQH0_9FIRM|nr:sulfurtransferase-like selenium metabolism protein YedF [Alkaliphilus serpentinus]KAB3531772.1 sulfurtransferase-like selenium metabolism protein YedF [Alkaliphilus serpentinus]